MKFIYIITIIMLNINIANAEFVKYVYDGDTFTTKDNKKVRLLDLNTTETAKKNKLSEKYSVEAKNKLKELIDNKEVILKYDDEKKDKYNRYLAYVYLKDGTFINYEMLKSGLAHLYSFPNNVAKYDQLREAENIARKQKINLWSDARWQVQNANSTKPIEKFRFGKYQMFKGKIINLTKVDDKIYLNFGTNWRTDFSVEIRTKNLKYFKFNPLDVYKDKTVLVRGILVPVNGGLINVTHPQQIEILAND